MRVLISGAGIAGPTLARLLAKTGASITIVEKADTIRPHGQNVDIKGSALAALEKMGLLDEVLRCNTTEKGAQFIDPNGMPIAPFPVQEGVNASLTSAFEIMRSDLSRILYDATKHLPNIDYIFGCTVKNVVSNDEHSVKVELEDGGIREFDLLVAADGQWSKIRKQCFPSESVKVIHKGMYAAYWTVPRLPTDNDLWNIYLALGSRIIATRPDPYGTTRAMMTCMPLDDSKEQAWRIATRSGREAQQGLMKAEFKDAGWQAERLLDAMGQSPDFYFQAIEQVRMSTWWQGRVICIGDAAYAPTPLTGMGTPLAILGAYILAGELSKLGDIQHPKKAFEAYESAFRPYVERTQKIAPVFPGIVHPKAGMQRWLVQLFLRCVSSAVAIPWVSKRLPSETDDEGFPLPIYPCFEDGKWD